MVFSGILGYLGSYFDRGISDQHRQLLQGIKCDMEYVAVLNNYLE